jgi:alkanesulfonate monooxygenase SsuD/methylene tetrahydromethanopterin reductase-like flavin-dependent oxidoreductase (luciferase family)
MDEYLRCLEALWTQDPVEFAGEFYSVPRSHVAPPPVQRPHPPVLLGGAAAPALRRAGRLAQGWICSSDQDLAGLGAKIAAVRAAAPDPDAVQIVVRRSLAGMRELGDLAALGVTEVILDLNLSPGADAERALEEFAPMRPRPSA